MFYDPLKVLVKGQGGKKALKGFAKATIDLIKNTIKSILVTVNDILGAVMKILTFITLHPQY